MRGSAGALVPPAPRRAPCRVLVGGVGLPWRKDLDLGTQLVDQVASDRWPPGTVVEDLSYAAHRVLHRLEELEPRRVVLVGAMPRGGDPPGTVRCYRLDLSPPPAEEVAERLGESVGGVIDLDHTLAVARHWRALPTDTVVVEVEPGDCTFGLGFSDAVAAAVPAVVARLRREVDRPVAVDGAAGGRR